MISTLLTVDTYEASIETCSNGSRGPSRRSIYIINLWVEPIVDGSCESGEPPIDTLRAVAAVRMHRCLCAYVGAASRQRDELAAPVPDNRLHNVRLRLPEVRVLHNEWRV